MRSTHINPETIVAVYRYMDKGITYTKVAQTLGIPRTQVNSVFRHLPKYLSGRAREQQRKETNYLEAVRIIKREQRKRTPTQSAPEASQKPTEAPHVTALKEAYAHLDRAVKDFVQAEIAIRYGGILQEIEELKRDLERVAQGRQERTRNWIDELAGGKQ